MKTDYDKEEKWPYEGCHEKNKKEKTHYKYAINTLDGEVHYGKIKASPSSLKDMICRTTCITIEDCCGGDTYIFCNKIVSFFETDEEVE